MPQGPLDYKSRPPPPPVRAHVQRLVIGLVPLVMYPFCLLANIMSLAAEEPPGTPQSLGMRAAIAFFWSSSFYPAVYLVAAPLSLLMASNDRPAAARRFALVPLLYLAGVALCFAAWMKFE